MVAGGEQRNQRLSALRRSVSEQLRVNTKAPPGLATQDTATASGSGSGGAGGGSWGVPPPAATRGASAAFTAAPGSSERVVAGEVHVTIHPPTASHLLQEETLARAGLGKASTKKTVNDWLDDMVGSADGAPIPPPGVRLAQRDSIPKSGSHGLSNVSLVDSVLRTP